MQDHEDYMRRHDEPEDDGDEQAATDPLEALFLQHPVPWVVDDNREGHEGEVTVYDATGGVIICVGDMEDCTGADIQLAHAIAAIPKLLELARAVAADYPDAADWKDARQHLWSIARGALDVAHAA